MRTIDMVGQQFGSLIVLSRSPRRGRTYWLCRCECGNECECEGYKLRQGLWVSCGCKRGENGKARWTKHGLKRRGVRTPEYDCWAHMRRRCFDVKSPDFKNYGGRGIAICDRWTDFALFFEDMGPRPSASHTIERRDNNANYSPDNCIWATRAAQNQNKRNIIRVTIDGRDLTIKQLANLSGLSHTCIYKRIRRGFSGAALIGGAT